MTFRKGNKFGKGGWRPGAGAKPTRTRQEKLMLSRARCRRMKISEDDYLRIFKAQGGACVGCKRTGVALVVDHSHLTGKNRGLLCGHCNSAIAFAREDAETLGRLAYYLGRYEATPIVNKELSQSVVVAEPNPQLPLLTH